MKTINSLINHVLSTPIESSYSDGTQRSAEIEEFNIIMLLGEVIAALEKMNDRIDSGKVCRPARLKAKLEKCEFNALMILDSVRYLMAARTCDADALENISFVLERYFPKLNRDRNQTA